jgi:hypothetical protein
MWPIDKLTGSIRALSLAGVVGDIEDICHLQNGVRKGKESYHVSWIAKKEHGGSTLQFVKSRVARGASN